MVLGWTVVVEVLCAVAVAADTEAPEELVLRRKAVVRRNEAELLPEAREL
jgi:hypothetical protein